MSILGSITTQISDVKETLNPFKTMSVTDIEIEGNSFDWVFEYVDERRLKRFTSSMTEEDIIVPQGTINRRYEESYLRFAYYVCWYFLMNPAEYKVGLKDIMKKDKDEIPIIMNIVPSSYSYVVNHLHVVLPNGSKMIIKYSKH